MCKFWEMKEDLDGGMRVGGVESFVAGGRDEGGLEDAKGGERLRNTSHSDNRTLFSFSSREQCRNLIT